MVLASETTESQEEHAKISSNSSNERPAVSGKRKYTQGMINKLVEAKIKSVTIFMKKKKTKSVTRTEFFFWGWGGGWGRGGRIERRTCFPADALECDGNHKDSGKV